MDLSNMTSYDFSFRAVDDEGAYCRYDAVLAYTPTDDEAASLGIAAQTCYLIYMDENPDDAGEVATYASILADPSAAEKAQLVVDSGCTPKKPPLLVLEAFDSAGEWTMIEELLDAVDRTGAED